MGKGDKGPKIECSKSTREIWKLEILQIIIGDFLRFFEMEIYNFV